MIQLNHTGEVASKVAIVLSIIRPFWLIYVGLRTIYGKRLRKIAKMA